MKSLCGNCVNRLNAKRMSHCEHRIVVETHAGGQVNRFECRRCHYHQQWPFGQALVCRYDKAVMKLEAGVFLCPANPAHKRPLVTSQANPSETDILRSLAPGMSGV